MFLRDTPQQFLQLILNASYKGQRLQNPPDKVDLVIWSFSREVMYRASEAQKLILKADSESWNLVPQTYLTFRGETKNGQDIFWEEKRTPAGQPSSLPENARIKNGQEINGIFMEQIFFQLKPEQLSKIATARSVELKMGATEFALIVDYQNIARSFLSRIDPSFQSDNNVAGSVRQSTPSPGQRATVKVEEEVINGKVISLPLPRYPSMAISMNASGNVKVLVTIGEAGTVIAARALGGHPLLREAAEEAARLSRFTPTFVSGRAVKVSGTISYNFIR
jgi:TonB family protein